MASSALRSDDDHGPSCEKDFAAWAFHQAMLLRAGQLHLLDRAWIAEELDTLGRKEFRTLESALARVMQHMLKWDFQPDRRSLSWQVSIANHREMVGEQLADSPSLSARQAQAVLGAYPRARRDAAVETGLALKTFPLVCAYTWDEIMNRSFELPGDEDRA